MYIIGTARLESNLILNPAGTGEIRNAYIERVTTLQEEAIATTLGLQHTGRIIFNTTIGGLKQWNGGSFTSVATDVSGISGQATALQVAIGPIISTSFVFDPLVAGQLSNIGAIDPESVFDVFKAIDTAIGELKAPTAFNTLTGIKVLNPTDNQLLKYSTTDSAWINDGIALTDLTEINATSTEVNYLAGTTSSVQGQFGALADDLSLLSTQLAAAESLIAALKTPYTQSYTDEAVFLVAHNRNQRYVQVIVVDADSTQVIPTSVVFTDANNLIVTLPAEGTGTIIVS